MINRVQGRRRKSRVEAGSAFIELALFFPVLLLLLLGAIDFSRLYYASITLINSAEVGAIYGSQSVAKTSDTSGMTNAATTDGQDLSGVTATAQQYCKCGNGSAQACSITCVGSTKQYYVSVQTAYTFTPLFPYPGIPSSVAMTRTAVMRAQ